MCTIAHTPRLPEHCVEFVRMLLWPQEKPFGGKVIAKLVQVTKQSYVEKLHHV